jgi:uncharacterized membrane protein YidH (DUF202 family)
MGNNDEQSEKRLNGKIRRFTAIAWVLVVIGIGVACFGLERYRNFHHQALTDLGTFLAGSTGPLFSLAGLFFIYVAFLGQQLQLKLQRKELQETQRQMRLQEKRTERERFESVFFELLNLHNSIIENIDGPVQVIPSVEEIGKVSYTPGNTIYTGRRFFERLAKQLRKEFKDYCARSYVMGNEREKVDVFYKAFFATYQAQLGHYFRNLYHVVAFIDESAVDERRKYLKILRAQVSAPELAVLFYNGLGPYGVERFKPLIEKYAFFEQFDLDDLINREHKAFYEQSAYSDELAESINWDLKE